MKNKIYYFIMYSIVDIRTQLSLYNTHKLKKKNLENYDFETLSLILRKKSLLLDTNKLLKLLNHKDKNITKKFLTIYMIYSFPKDVLHSEINDNYTKFLVIQSRKVINSIDGLTAIYNTNNINFFIQKIDEFNIIFKKYVTLFDEWKSKDKIILINELIKMYYEIEDVPHNFTRITDEDKKLILENSDREKMKIIDRIKQIDSKEGYNYFIKVKSDLELFQNQISDVYKNIEKTVHSAFWDSIRNSLAKEPPDYLVLIPLLKDIKYLLGLCVPNRRDILIEIEEKIDTDLIKQMIEYDAIDNKYVYELCMYIIYYIEKFQSSEQNKITKLWKDDIIKQFDNIEFKTFFPIFFKESFNKLEAIIENKCIFENSPYYEGIKEMIKNKKIN